MLSRPNGGYGVAGSDFGRESTETLALRYSQRSGVRGIGDIGKRRGWHLKELSLSSDTGSSVRGPLGTIWGLLSICV